MICASHPHSWSSWYVGRHSDCLMEKLTELRSPTGKETISLQEQLLADVGNGDVLAVC